MTVFGLTQETMDELEAHAEGCWTRSEDAELDEFVLDTEKIAVFVSMAVSLKKIARALEKIERAILRYSS